MNTNKKLVVSVVSAVIAISSTIQAYAPTQAMGVQDKAVLNTVSNSATVSIRFAKCHNTIHPTAVQNNGFGHPVCLPAGNDDSDVQTNNTKQHKVQVTVITTTQKTEVTKETPKVTETKETPKTPKVKKQHCNNGNGNGAEGCNASVHGNNDETTFKGDKVTTNEHKKIK